MKEYDEYAFYRYGNGKIRYNGKCTNCIHDCKQSYRVSIIQCLDYIDHRKLTKRKADRSEKISFVSLEEKRGL